MIILVEFLLLGIGKEVFPNGDIYEGGYTDDKKMDSARCLNPRADLILALGSWEKDTVWFLVFLRSRHGS